jgi:hypothetical protein
VLSYTKFLSELCLFTSRIMRHLREALEVQVSTVFVKRRSVPHLLVWLCLTAGLLLASICWMVVPLYGREHPRKKESYGLGFSVEVPAPESEVLQALDQVVRDGIIQGSKEYNKDKYIEKADAADTCPLFPEWKEGGKVFYKVREQVLAPANFYESNDEGTLAVRYIVQPKDATKTMLRIDAVFVEDFRRTVHPSDGSVETAEYGDIQNQIDAIELQKKQAQESEQRRQQEIARQAMERKKEEEELAMAQNSAEDLERYVEKLRRKAERVVKAPGAELRSAPFHSASNLRALQAGSEVVILVSTPYWYGVETEDGQHGWVYRDQLELLP